MALRDEGGHLLEEAGAKVLYTGLGKVNAAYKLAKYLALHQPKLVLNMGTVGSRLYNRGEVVQCTHFIQRDMDTSPIGYKRFATPFEDVPMIIEHPQIFTNLPKATCGSGDSFVTDHSHDLGEVVDMEAYALAKVCMFENVPFACIKYVSDGANQDASGHWEESLVLAGNCFLGEYIKLVEQDL